MGVILGVLIMLGAYIKRFGSDFEDDDKAKVTVFIVGVAVITIIITFLTNR